MIKQWVMFTVGPVRALDHDSGCSVASVWNQPQGLQEVGLILCPFRNVTEVGSQRSPRTPGGPQVDLEVLVAQHI